MADKIATRDSYGNALVACAEDFPNLVVSCFRWVQL